MTSCFGLRKVLPEPWNWVKVGLTLVCNSSTSPGIWSSAGTMRTWNLDKESLAVSKSLFPCKSWIFHKQMIDQSLCANPTEFTQWRDQNCSSSYLKSIWTVNTEDENFSINSCMSHSMFLLDREDLSQNQVSWELGNTIMILLIHLIFL